MRDEQRLCGSCKHEHAWGILRYSADGVPKYGPRLCDAVVLSEGKLFDHDRQSCCCDHFVAAVEGAENLPALTQDQTQALWSQTSFLNAQVPAATRIAISGIMLLLEVGSANLDPAIAGAVREFMGLMVSQITDIRSALTKNDNKFAHLVAHTDEIVEAMRGVVQLKERLDTIYVTQERILERLDTLSKPGMLVNTQTNEATMADAARQFDSKSAPLWNEPIAVASLTLEGEPDEE